MTWANPEGHSLLNSFEFAVKELRSMKTDISSLRTESSARISSLEAKNQESSFQISSLEAKNSSLTAEVNSTRTEIGSLRTERIFWYA
jgi:cell division protein FtsB